MQDHAVLIVEYTTLARPVSSLALNLFLPRSRLQDLICLEVIGFTLILSDDE